MNVVANGIVSGYSTLNPHELDRRNNQIDKSPNSNDFGGLTVYITNCVLLHIVTEPPQGLVDSLLNCPRVHG